MQKNLWVSAQSDADIAIGCNTIIWDSILIGIGAGYLLSKVTVISIHPVFCILGGIAAAVIFFLLSHVKIVNIILLSLSTLCYFYLAHSNIIKPVLEKHPEWDMVWNVTAYIVTFLLIAVWHAASYFSFHGPFSEMDMDYHYHPAPKHENAQNYVPDHSPNEDWDSLRKHYQSLLEHATKLISDFSETLAAAKSVSELESSGNDLAATAEDSDSSFRHECKEFMRLREKIKAKNLSYSEASYVIDEMDERYSSLLQIHQQLMKKTQEVLISQRGKQSVSGFEEDCDESLFSGCHDRESLTKRYRNLMKLYHPDNANGDLSMTRKIQHTYETLLDQMPQ